MDMDVKRRRMERFAARSQHFAARAAEMLDEGDDSELASNVRDLELASEIVRQQAAEQAGLDPERSLARKEVAEAAAQARKAKA